MVNLAGADAPARVIQPTVKHELGWRAGLYLSACPRVASFCSMSAGG
jgi:hypothetical protein